MRLVVMFSIMPVICLSVEFLRRSPQSTIHKWEKSILSRDIPISITPWWEMEMPKKCLLSKVRSDSFCLINIELIIKQKKPLLTVEEITSQTTYNINSSGSVILDQFVIDETSIRRVCHTWVGKDSRNRIVIRLILWFLSAETMYYPKWPTWCNSQSP